MTFLFKFSQIYVLSPVIKDFVMTVTNKPKIDTTQTRLSKNLAKSALWTSPYKMSTSVLLVKNLIGVYILMT